MTPLAVPLQAALAVLVVAAAIFDVRERRIPNWLTASGVVAGIAMNSAIAGWQGTKAASLGLGLAFVIYLALFALHAAGGGDVKLMAAIGSFSGPSNWLVIFVFSSILGGVAAVVLALAKGRLRTTLRNVLRILRELVAGRAPYERNPDLDVSNPAALRLPYGAVIAGGALAFLLAARAL